MPDPTSDTSFTEDPAEEQETDELSGDDGGDDDGTSLWPDSDSDDRLGRMHVGQFPGVRELRRSWTGRSRTWRDGLKPVQRRILHTLFEHG